MFIDAFPSTASTAIDLDGATMNDFTASTSCSSAITTGFNGWRMDLNAGRGEQTVTSSLIAGGLVYFSTNRPLATAVAACTNNLGEARGYAVNLLNASGAVGTDALCGGTRSGIFLGGGLPPSPVLGIVPIAGKPTTVMIGGIDRSGATSSPIGSQKILPVIAQKRTRTYWYRHGDK